MTKLEILEDLKEEVECEVANFRLYEKGFEKKGDKLQSIYNGVIADGLEKAIEFIEERIELVKGGEI